MKTGFSLWELTYREFPVSITGFGFAVYRIFSQIIKQFSRHILRERNQSMGHFLPSQKHSFLKVDERQSNWFWATTIEMLYRPLDIPILVLEGKLSR